VAAPAEACRLALVLALDVSSSVDAAEDQLQRDGLATALLAPDVQDAFLTGPDPVAVQVFEWSGRGHQTDLVDWTLVRTASDLEAISARLRQTQRSARGLPTAMGHALAYAAIKLDDGPDCIFQTIDLAGDGANNDGFGPSGVYATFPLEGVTVNGLAVVGDDHDPVDYYSREVIRGALAFVEVANGFAAFQSAMERKLIRELSSQVLGRARMKIGDQG
jgi:hypothetical protein